MKNATRVLVAAALILLLAAFVGAQKGQRAAQVTTRHSIEIGQSLTEVQAVMRDRGLGEARFARIGPSENDSITCAIEPRVYAEVTYSKATEKVIWISLYFMPQHSSKLTHNWVPAKSIVLQEDGSYVVHFLPTPK